MSTDLRLEITSISTSNTEEIAQKVGEKLKGSEVIELVSDLGGGKTVFAKGLARGAGSQDIVSSPTFTLSKIYKCPNFNIAHFDFYRLNDAGIIGQELLEVVKDNQTVTVIEWADVVKNVLNNKHVKITLVPTGSESRQIIFEVPIQYDYLLEGLS